MLVTLGGSGFGTNLWGDLLAFTMTVAVAVAMVICRRHRDIPMVPAAALSIFFGSIVSLPWAAPAGGRADRPGLSGPVRIVPDDVGIDAVHHRRPADPCGAHGERALEAPLAPLWVWIALGENAAGDWSSSAAPS